MRIRLVIGAAMLMLSVTSASVAATQTGFDGSDGGYVVYSVGTERIGMNFSFPYHRIALADGSRANDWKGVIEPKLGGMWVSKIKDPDFTGRETGQVVVRRLPAGRYVIENFAFYGHTPSAAYSWSSGKPFRMQFTIAPNQTTYIGSFIRSPSLGTSLQRQLGAAGYFVVSDQAKRDVPIARGKLPSLPRVNVEVTDVDQFGSVALRSSDPE